MLGMLSDLCCVGVTGSCGKTTTKELIGAILATKGRCRKSNKTHNNPVLVAETIFTIRPWHRFCVHELGAPRPGVLAKSVKMLRPQIGVVTHIGYDHRASFRSLEATAMEKGILVESLPKYGTAVLNADDRLVLGMRERTRARVITYGLSTGAMVQGGDPLCAWPERLSLTARYGTERVRIHTRLLGEQWAYAVLAALATGIALGISLEECARAVETVEPVEGRMSPHQTAEGITFIRDDWKAPLWTISASLRFMQTARANRKVVIIGTISDYPGSSSKKYRGLARQALEVAEKVIFVGNLAHQALKARSHPDDDRIVAFDTVYQLNLFLRSYLKTGDLVLLKGSGTADHLQRLVLSRTNDIDCWRVSCGKPIFCTSCENRQSPFIPSLQ